MRVKPRFGLGDIDPVAVEEATGTWRRYAAVLESHLHDRRWLVGDSLTVADFAVAAALPDAERAHVPVEGFLAIRRWHDRLDEIDALREPLPERAVPA